MTRFAMLLPPFPSHLANMGALGGELRRRGHETIVIGVPDLAGRAAAAGLAFRAIGEGFRPCGSVPFHEHLGALTGMAAIRFEIATAAAACAMIAAQAPAALTAAGIQAVLVDQLEPMGGTIAEHLGLPFITVSNALPLQRESGLPPVFTSWDHRGGALARLRNRMGHALCDRLAAPLFRAVARQRAAWSLPPHRYRDDADSRLLAICQLVPELDFPRLRPPASLRYGPVPRGPRRAHRLPLRAARRTPSDLRLTGDHAEPPRRGLPRHRRRDGRPRPPSGHLARRRRSRGGGRVARRTPGGPLRPPARSPAPRQRGDHPRRHEYRAGGGGMRSPAGGGADHQRSAGHGRAGAPLPAGPGRCRCAGSSCGPCARRSSM